jgi:hypothetical protein
MLFEDLCEVTVAGEAHVLSDLRERQIRFPQKTLGSLKPFEEEKLVWAFASGLAEETCKMIATETDLLCKQTHRKSVLKVGIDEIDYPSHLLRRKTLCIFWHSNVLCRIVTQEMDKHHFGCHINIEPACKNGAGMLLVVMQDSTVKGVGPEASIE